MGYSKSTLEEYVRSRSGERINYRVLYDTWKMINEGKLIIEDMDKPNSFATYVTRLDYTLWFWTAMSLNMATLILVYVTELAPQLLVARYVFGTIYVLFLPGYLLTEALYPRGEDITPLERVALSIGLSLAIVPLVGLVLNYTPWGIRLAPILVSLTLFNVLISIAALYRKYSLLTAKPPLRVGAMRQ